MKKNDNRQRQTPKMSQESLTTKHIRQRAYEIFLELGGTPGSALDHWLQAEREIHEGQNKPPRP